MAGAKTVPAYLAFLGICYLTVGSFDYRLALLAGVTAWLLVILIAFFAPRWI